MYRLNYNNLNSFCSHICFCSWLALTNPADVARVESRTFMCTRNKRDTIPKTMAGVKGTLGNWMSLEDMDKAIKERFPGCMEGRNIQYLFSSGFGGEVVVKSKSVKITQ